MPIFIWALLISLSSLPVIVSAQSNIKLAGSVYDAFDRQPLAGAVIRVDNSSFDAVTDQLGYYEISGIPVGDYSLTVECDGYLPATVKKAEISEDITNWKNHYLTRKIHRVDGVRVRGTASKFNIESMAVVTQEEITRSSSHDLLDLLDNMNGVYVQETGSGGGESRVSIRGCDPKHVLILLDGHKIDNSAGGQANLNEIPLDAVERIEVFKGGASARFGGQGMGGVINILTSVKPGARKLQPRVGTEKGWGKWKTTSLGLSLYDMVPISRLTSKFVYNTETSNGDFDYNYSGVSPQPQLIRPVIGLRDNDHSDRESYFVAGQYLLAAQSRLRFSGQVLNSTAGLPGPVGDVDSTAFKDEDKIYFSGQLDHRFFDRLKGELSAGYVRLTQYFNNMGNSRAAERYEDRFRNDRFDTRLNLSLVAASANQLSGGIVVERDILYHNNIYRPAYGSGRTTRDNLGIYIADRQSWVVSMVPMVDVAVLDISFRTDFTQTENRAYQANDTLPDEDKSSHFYSPKVGFSIISGRGADKRLVLRGSYGRSYQLPEINAMFWKGNVRSSGNADLLPERSEHSDIGLEIVREGRINLSAGVTYYHSYIKDIVVWKRSSPLGVWQPVNERAAQITGHEEFVQLSFFKRRIELNYQNQIIDPINKSNGGKILTYRPHYITRYEAAIELGPIRSVYKTRLVDRRYLTEINSKYDDSYRLDDWDVTVSQKFGAVDLRSTWEINNLRDVEYVLIKRYPMPGRHWKFQISLTYNFDQE